MDSNCVDGTSCFPAGKSGGRFPPHIIIRLDADDGVGYAIPQRARQPRLAAQIDDRIRRCVEIFQNDFPQDGRRSGGWRDINPRSRQSGGYFLCSWFISFICTYYNKFFVESETLHDFFLMACRSPRRVEPPLYYTTVIWRFL